MKAIPQAIPEVVLFEPTVFSDERGFFFESFSHHQFEKTIQRKVEFVQENQSLSHKNVLRGLHYQIRRPQGKLIRVIRGEIFDVAIDLRRSSPTFGCYVSAILTEKNKFQIWIPEGFAHGFLSLSENTEIQYKTTDYYSPQDERCIIWNDLTLSINWPISGRINISNKDKQGLSFINAEAFV